MDVVRTSIAAGLARITINRPEKRNALDRATVVELTAALERCERDPGVRVVQITGAGDVFCAGADLAEMQAQRDAGEDDNLANAARLTTLLGTLDALSKPTLARVNGDGYGGAIGLLGACDIVIAAVDAKFAFTEVRLGIIPAVISPFVLAKIGESAARRYFLTAETLTAERLKDMRLVHEVAPAGELDRRCEQMVEALLLAAPGALAEAKRLIRDVARATEDRTAISADMARRLSRLRVQAEAQEGFRAFFERRKPGWATPP
ncbi:MAG: enoyl-CoA hydratase-related protein [Steroidobacteraceae bacterium]